jgi:cobalt/nickel transport system permease protein
LWELKRERSVLSCASVNDQTGELTVSHLIQRIGAANRLGDIARIDPRARIVAAIVFSVIVAEVHSFAALGAALATVVLAAVFSGLSPAILLRRLLPLNALVAILAILLPLSAAGRPVATIGVLCFSQEGLLMAAKIALKGNAIVLAIVVMIGTMDMNTLGHALSHLRAPAALTHLFLFTVRYLEVLHGEYVRLRGAMKVRCFRPRMDGHTYRSTGNLLGMLFVRGYDRSERILAAMRCRGFQGRFYLLDHFVFQRRDAIFCAVSSLLLMVIIIAELL